MRPLVLTVQGFGTFRQPTTVDFTDVDFFALVGPTGSGKSTVVDAICFALYGSVPRYDDQRLVGSAVSLGHVEARVHLTFEVGGHAYVAARVVRVRDGKASTREARLERLAGSDGTGVETLAGSAREMDKAVPALLGLPFEHFTRSVVLPQGEFARFLHDKPADRQDLLVRLLDLGVYERMARAARQRASEANAEVALAERRLAELAGATPEALADATARAQALLVLIDRLTEAAPEVATLVATAASAEHAAAQLATEAAALSRAAQVPAAVRTHADAVAAAQAALARAEALRVEAEREHEDQQARQAALPPMAELKAAQQAHARLARVQREAEQAEADQATAAEVETVGRTAAAATAEAAARARAQREEAVRAEAAHHLRAGLHPGDTCPVCVQPVARVPVLAAPPGLADVEEAVMRAEADAATAQATHRRAGFALTAATTAAHSARAQLAPLEAEVAAHPDPLALAELATHVEAADHATQAAWARLREAAGRVKEAAAEVERVDAAAGAQWEELHRRRDPLTVAGAPTPVAGDLAGSWDRLAAWATARAPEVEAARATAGEEAIAARSAAVALVDAAAAAAEGVGVAAPAGRRLAADDPPAVLDAMRHAAVRAQAAAAERVAAIERERAEAQRLADTTAGRRADAQVAQQLGQLLSATGFVRWLVAEAMQRLALGASARLHELSGGQYSLESEPGGEFVVVDHANGDERRGVRTLSGGETFQASLALALALADELAGFAAGGAAKLDAIFLDEGFGTLDPESLETVAATVESLGSTGRMVGVVTHVRELAARVPVRFEVRKGQGTSTVERVTA